ncbi:MAG: hypothetical protein QOI73_1573 [Solirubrobacteraceae bacterium]|nr:hypothetical protein [Solirubrobacteraceae bacterium]
MGFGGNFNSEVNLVSDPLGLGDVIQLVGQSQALPGGKLVSRHVGLQQAPDPKHPTDAVQFVDGPTTNLDTQWDARIRLADVVDPQAKKGPTEAPVFREDPALAIATETHFMPSPPSGTTAAFVTLTWSTAVTITRKAAFKDPKKP